MISKRELLERIENHEDRIIDMSYEINLLNKRIADLTAPKVVKRKPGRPRKNAK